MGVRGSLAFPLDVDGNGVIDYEEFVARWAGPVFRSRQRGLRPLPPARRQMCTPLSWLPRRSAGRVPVDMAALPSCPPCLLSPPPRPPTHTHTNNLHDAPPGPPCSTMNLSMLEREEVCIKAFQQLDKARGSGWGVGGKTACGEHREAYKPEGMDMSLAISAGPFWLRPEPSYDCGPASWCRSCTWGIGSRRLTRACARTPCTAGRQRHPDGGRGGRGHGHGWPHGGCAATRLGLPPALSAALCAAGAPARRPLVPRAVLRRSWRVGSSALLLSAPLPLASPRRCRRERGQGHDCAVRRQWRQPDRLLRVPQGGCRVWAWGGGGGGGGPRAAAVDPSLPPIICWGSESLTRGLAPSCTCTAPSMHQAGSS